MDFYDIYFELGEDMKTIKRRTYKEDSDVVFSTFPSFMNSEYHSLRNIVTNEEIFLLFKNNKLVYVTQNISKIFDKEQAVSTLNLILDNL